MNKVMLMGRLTADPEIRYSNTNNGSMCIARYRLAVDRRARRSNSGNQEDNVDFISCVAFGGAGSFAEKYLKKGTKIVICGHIQTGSYTNRDGQKVYTTDVIVDEHYFAESKGNQNSGAGSYNQNYQNGSQQNNYWPNNQNSGADSYGQNYQNGNQQNNYWPNNQNSGAGSYSQNYQNGSQQNNPYNQAPAPNPAPAPAPNGAYQNNPDPNPNNYIGGDDGGFMNIPDGIDEELPFN